MKTTEELLARIEELESTLKEIHRGSIPKGRWIKNDDDCSVDTEWPPSEFQEAPPNSHWLEYDEEDQRDWLDSVAEFALIGLAGDEDYSGFLDKLKAEYNA